LSKYLDNKKPTPKEEKKNELFQIEELLYTYYLRREILSLCLNSLDPLDVYERGLVKVMFVKGDPIKWMIGIGVERQAVILLCID
jgi:hypothetical protein